jgi:hypothetical protein
MIYFRFLAVYQLIMPPKRWHCASPAPRACRTSPSYPPLSWKPVFGWLLHNKSSIGGHQMPRCILILIFRRSIRRPKQWDNVPHTFLPCPVSSLMPPSPLTTTFGWLLCPHIKWRQSKAKSPSISLFFLINSTPQTMGSRPPHTFRPSLVSSQTHTLMSTPSSI